MVLGRDARLQLVHELDAVGVMEHLAVGDFSGTVNVAGDGAITLAQAIHRAGRVPLAVPAFALDGLSRTMRTLRMGGFSPGQVKLLSAGRVLDTTRLRERADYIPRFTTIEAFDDFAADAPPGACPGRPCGRWRSGSPAPSAPGRCPDVPAMAGSGRSLAAVGQR